MISQNIKTDTIIRSEIILTNGSVLTPLERVNVDHYIVECSVCSLDNGLWPYGSIIIRRDHLINRITPCGCSNSPRWTFEQMKIRAERSLICKGHSLLKITKRVPFSESITTCNCSLHGVWETRLVNLINKQRGCPTCGGSLKRSEQNAVETVKKKCSDKGYDFIKFTKGYVNKNSRMIVLCRTHGEWSTTFNNFVNNNRCCSDCSISGFRNHNVGYLYHLRSKCGNFSKIGITNNIKTRMYKLKPSTPFEFDLVDSVEFEKGSHARLIEKSLHECFTSAGLKGFDGCTEWFNSDPSIDRWFKLL